MIANWLQDFCFASDSTAVRLRALNGTADIGPNGSSGDIGIGLPGTPLNVSIGTEGPSAPKLSLVEGWLLESAESTISEDEGVKRVANRKDTPPRCELVYTP